MGWMNPPTFLQCYLLTRTYWGVCLLHCPTSLWGQDAKAPRPPACQHRAPNWYRALCYQTVRRVPQRSRDCTMQAPCPQARGLRTALCMRKSRVDFNI